MPKKQKKQRLSQVYPSQDVTVLKWSRGFCVVTVVGVIVVYLITANATATRSLEVSGLEDEIEELLVERSELTIQEAHLRHKAYGEVAHGEEWQNAAIVGYVSLSLHGHEGNIVALSE